MTDTPTNESVTIKSIKPRTTIGHQIIDDPTPDTPKNITAEQLEELEEFVQCLCDEWWLPNFRAALHTLRKLPVRDGVVMTPDEMKRELVEAHEDAFYGSATLIEKGEKAGWYDTNALSHVMEAGDALVDLGVFEVHPDGFGRRWFYRPKERAAREASGGQHAKS